MKSFPEEVSALRATVKSEIVSISERVLETISKYRIPTAGTESKVFFWKLYGDYNNYAYEIYVDDDSEGKHFFANAVEGYSIAYEASKDLPPTHPIRLGLCLNFSSFTYETLKNQEDACNLARQAFDEALAEVDNIAEDDYKDATLIMELLRDNLNMWTSSENDD